MKYLGAISNDYDLVNKKYIDTNFLSLTGGTVTGPVTFGDSIAVDEATLGDLVVTGSASITNNLQVNTINGVTVGSSPKFTDNNTYTTAYCSTAAATAAKVATCTGYNARPNTHMLVTITNSNTAASALTLNINSQGAKPIYINGSASSSSNYTLNNGTYLVYFDGTNYYFRTDGQLQSANGILTSKAGTVTSITITQGTGITVSSSGTAITSSGTRTISLATSGATAGSYGSSTNYTLAPNVSMTIPYITVDTYGRVTSIANRTVSYNGGDVIQATGTSGSTLSLASGTITQVSLTTTTINRNDRQRFTLASNRIAITGVGVYRITGSVYVTPNAASAVGVYLRQGTGTFANATEIAASLLYANTQSGIINLTKTIQITDGTTQYIYLGARCYSAAGTLSYGNNTFLEIEELG